METLNNGLVQTAVAAAIVPQVNSFGTHSVCQWQWQSKTFMFMHYFAVATSRIVKKAVATAAPCEWTFKVCSHLTNVCVNIDIDFNIVCMLMEMQIQRTGSCPLHPNGSVIYCS